MIKICNEIPGSCNWQTIKAIKKGWSNDQKYYIQTSDGRELLLRISDISQYENKKQEFEAIKQLDDIDILISRPVDFGICDNSQYVYSLLTWIKGEDAETVLPMLSHNEQYEPGVKAGEVLKIIHQIPAPNDRFHGRSVSITK